MSIALSKKYVLLPGGAMFVTIPSASVIMAENMTTKSTYFGGMIKLGRGESVSLAKVLIELILLQHHTCVGKPIFSRVCSYIQGVC